MGCKDTFRLRARRHGSAASSSQGIDRQARGDAQQQAALRFSDPFALELAAEVKNKGLEFFSSRRTPPTYAWLLAKKSFRRMNLLPKPTAGGVTWKDGEKIPDVNLQEFGTYSECVAALAAKTIDALTTDDTILAGFAAQAQYVQVRTCGTCNFTGAWLGGARA